MNSHNQLEYNKIKDFLGQECHSVLGSRMASNLQPMSSISEITQKLELASEIQLLLKKGISHNFENISDIKEIISKQQHQTYNFEEFQQIYFNVSTANRISKSTDELEDHPQYLKFISRIIPLDDIEVRFNQIFESDGEVKDNASSALASIRRKKKRVRKNLVSTINRKVESLSTSNFLHDNIVTQRDGRYVIPIKEGASTFVPGIVHGRSSSKSSIYMEPQEIVSLNNDLELVSSEEKQEIFQIFKDYTEIIIEHKSILLKEITYLQEMDFFFASSRLANRLKAEKPILSEKPQIKLKNARHPLLILTFDEFDDVIPFDLELGFDYNLLLVSGPNTGGKTVTLKTVGLLTLMAKSGLPIPADPHSVIGSFNSVFADIGDSQSLENALSTFSSHIKNIREMTEDTKSNMLVLIDEIGAATDPEQGSALAQAILENLAENGAVGVISTHYTSLKVFAEKHEKCINAAMQFDPEKHKPTYQFKLGLPGNSFAIEVAARLGLQKDLIERAKNLTGKQNVELTELIKKMSEEKKSLSRQLYQFELKTALLNQKINEHQNQIESLEIDKKEIKKKSIRDAREFLTSMQKELNLEIKDIKQSNKKEKKDKFEKSLKKVTQLNRDLSSEEEKLSEISRESVSTPKIGMKVWLKEMEMEGEITEISGKNIKVDMDGIFLNTTSDRLYLITEKKVNKSLRKKLISVPKSNAKMELKILGFRFDEALPEIETFIDNAVVNGLFMIRIVHGKGTGVLRSKVRNYLRTNRNVEEFFTPPPEAGGSGVTVVKIKE
ncbi:MAG: endonuclease MutS2 [Candidatus Cloacimonetes bacterium]|jgi:DNA mismatch repair protein MutS2|nr:endonuclease MutS2 [Candidatus Cloacimonadota bacterium]MBT4332250.1 endonuclease MutS2 [Candidatus Cloacimonadota bacterium]